MFSRECLERLGAETGFRPDTLEKVLRLERLLTGIRRHPFLGERLVLKGGTALNLFFGGPVPRLSVDLDLNYVHVVEREEMLRDKPEVERALRSLAEGDRYRLQWGRDEHAGRKIHSGIGTDWARTTTLSSTSISSIVFRSYRWSNVTDGRPMLIFRVARYSPGRKRS